MTFSSHQESDKREENRTGKFLRGKLGNSNRLGSENTWEVDSVLVRAARAGWGENSHSLERTRWKFLENSREKSVETKCRMTNRRMVSARCIDAIIKIRFHLFSRCLPPFSHYHGYVFDCNWAEDLNKNEDKLKDFLEVLTLSWYVFLQAAQKIESMFHSINVVIN